MDRGKLKLVLDRGEYSDQSPSAVGPGGGEDRVQAVRSDLEWVQRRGRNDAPESACQ